MNTKKVYSKDMENLTCRNNFLKIPFRSAVKIANEGLLNSMLAVASSYAKGDLIDIGCGTKPYEKVFSAYVESYFGVDYEPTAGANYAELTKADLYVDCTKTGLNGESYDTLLSTQVMEHVYDTAMYVKECHRLLKKGGTGIFTIPMSWRCHAEPYDFYRFTKYSLEKIFEENGFRIVELKAIEGAFASVIQHLIVFLSNRSYSKSYILGLLIKIIQVVSFSILNYIALKLDRIFWDEKFCLNYLLIVQKQ